MYHKNNNDCEEKEMETIEVYVESKHKSSDSSVWSQNTELLNLLKL